MVRAAGMASRPLGRVRAAAGAPAPAAAGAPAAGAPCAAVAGHRRCSATSTRCSWPDASSFRSSSSCCWPTAGRCLPCSLTSLRGPASSLTGSLPKPPSWRSEEARISFPCCCRGLLAQASVFVAMAIAPPAIPASPAIQPAEEGAGESWGPSPPLPWVTGVRMPVPEPPPPSGDCMPVPGPPLPSGDCMPVPGLPLPSGDCMPVPGPPLPSGDCMPVPGPPLPSGDCMPVPEPPLPSVTGVRMPGPGPCDGGSACGPGEGGNEKGEIGAALARCAAGSASCIEHAWGGGPFSGPMARHNMLT